jgi:adenylate kinase
MKVAVTGTPGVGKTAACKLVRTIRVESGNALAERLDAIVGRDEGRDTMEVDTELLSSRLSGEEGDLLVEGHFSHMLGVDLAIVIRCSPTVLGERLRTRGWPEPKVVENLEAEAVDVILVEALENVPKVCEIDATLASPAEVAESIEEILAGESEKYPVGNVDWSQEVLSWF